MYATQLHLTPSEKKWLIDNPIIYVGVDSNWKPIEFKNGNNYYGYSVDLLELISKKLTVQVKEVEIKEITQLEKMITNKEVSMFSAVINTEERMKYLRFCDHHLTLNTSICTLRKNKVSNLYELKSQKIAIVKGYAISEFLKKDYPNIKFLEVDSAKEALDLVLASEVEAYLDVTQTLKFYLKDKKYSQLSLTDTPSYTLELSLSVDKNDKTLHSILQKTLESIPQDKKDALAHKWFETNYFTDQRFLFKLFLLFGVVVLFIYIYILKNEKYR